MVKTVMECLNGVFTTIGIITVITIGMLGISGHIKIIDFAGKMAVILN